ncbi:unnamed protein product [Protopolystoma xenopodis]|uniref:Glycosyl hydrolase family 38 C-terminal domain-containing protein n=1 Tax=Protopolystoma xenopodis TaxID=117903 RepID=A0A448WSY7_9PLAT|nr:unnamed protein product [Protopolystoma xenopodis]
MSCAAYIEGLTTTSIFPTYLESLLSVEDLDPLSTLQKTVSQTGTDYFRLSLLSSQSLGVTSETSGELQVWLDRQLRFDDGRGLGEGISDNRATISKFRLLLEKVPNPESIEVSEVNDGHYRRDMNDFCVGV